MSLFVGIGVRELEGPNAFAGAVDSPPVRTLFGRDVTVVEDEDTVAADARGEGE